MGKRTDYKKSTTELCHFCDYCICRKGHKCRYYKKSVKTFKSNTLDKDLELARKDGPITREELGISLSETNDGLQYILWP